MKIQSVGQFLAIFLLVSGGLYGCGGSGGSDGDDDAENGDQALLEALERMFPFTPNQPFDVIFQCARQGSALMYTFDFRNDGTFDLYSTLDTGQDVGPYTGTYTYQNVELYLELNSVFIVLDEKSTSITPVFGLVGVFETPGMICGAVGHRYNDPLVEFSTTVHYDCPNINIQAVSFDINALEFVHRAVPYDLAVPGSAFRARDRFITPNPQAQVLRGYGLYRRLGNDFYILFAPGTFDDYNVLSGRFKNGNLQISVDQLEPGRGDCTQ